MKRSFILFLLFFFSLFAVTYNKTEYLETLSKDIDDIVGSMELTSITKDFYTAAFPPTDKNNLLSQEPSLDIYSVVQRGTVGIFRGSYGRYCTGESQTKCVVGVIFTILAFGVSLGVIVYYLVEFNIPIGWSFFAMLLVPVGASLVSTVLYILLLIINPILQQYSAIAKVSGLIIIAINAIIKVLEDKSKDHIKKKLPEETKEKS